MTKKGSTGSINFATYIRRILKQVHPDTSITSKGSAVLNDMTNELGKKIANIAVHTTSRVLNGQERMTVTSRNVQSSVRVGLP